MKILITGGAGFIGTNTAYHFSKDGHDVLVLDNLSRPGTQYNLEWLKENARVVFIKGDIRDRKILGQVLSVHSDIDVIIHLAAQTAVTESLRNPDTDFQINAAGTFYLLEAIRAVNPEIMLLYASTNKVYGKMEEVAVQEGPARYVFVDFSQGIDETQPLDFHSPYGCSKGTADQYVRDYARIFGLRTVVLRQSCIYGQHQFGVEDQGWVAWFLWAGLTGQKITVYGNGKQVRDILFVDDLVEAYRAAIERIDAVEGKVYNIGGGREFALSIWVEFREIMQEILAGEFDVSFREWRPGDQKIYISNITRAKEDMNWTPKITPCEGIGKLRDWMLSRWKANQSLSTPGNFLMHRGTTRRSRA